MLAAAVVLALSAKSAAGESETAPQAAVRYRISDLPVDPDVEITSDKVPALPAALMQPQPLLTPRLERMPAQSTSGAAASAGLSTARQASLSRRLRSSRSLTLSIPIGVDLVRGDESKVRASTDAGDLMDKSPSIIGVKSQRRNPVVTDPRVRGSRVGELAASGSHWVPARIDLDTSVSKIDSSALAEVAIIKGPYSARNGPGLEYVTFELLNSPRFSEGRDSEFSSLLEYKSNGSQWHGRQVVAMGEQDWGARLGYSDRHGVDYRAGNGAFIPSGYHSREFDFALGRDFGSEAGLEFNYIRLDQTDVELPGQAFDIDFLKTDGFDLAFTMADQQAYDLLEIDVWYNRTVFAGNAQGPGKRATFPFYDDISFVGNTDVDSMSAGYSIAASWGDVESTQLTAGVDLRYISQELNEITSGRIGFNIWNDANSPIPRSDWLNTGYFAEVLHRPLDRLRCNVGGRIDVVRTDVLADPAELQMLGTRQPQSSLEAILGTDAFDQNFTVWSLYAKSAYDLNDEWSLTGGAAFGQRPPSLTELYAAEPFMFLLQNGLNTVTGDPLLEAEKKYQVDVGLVYTTERLHAGINAYHAWINDRITFENTALQPNAGQVEQINLQYVNTDLATLAGVEGFYEYQLTDSVTPFATMTYVYGRDRSRNGNFATWPAESGLPKERVAGRPRGFFSTVTGPDDESLPGIPPMEARLGVRWHDRAELPNWAVEFSARLVHGQDQVATSLLEAPTPGFTVFDIRGYWRKSETLMLVAGIENLADRTYREHFDFRSPNGIQILQPGINAYLSSELRY